MQTSGWYPRLACMLWFRDSLVCLHFVNKLYCTNLVHIYAINTLICSRFTCNPTVKGQEKKRASALSYLIPSPTGVLADPINPQLALVRQCSGEQPKPREHHSFTCIAQERLSHATTLTFRCYNLKILWISSNQEAG
jgi:hypothetical protein